MLLTDIHCELKLKLGERLLISSLRLKLVFTVPVSIANFVFLYSCLFVHLAMTHPASSNVHLRAISLSTVDHLWEATRETFLTFLASLQTFIAVSSLWINCRPQMELACDFIAFCNVCQEHEWSRRPYSGYKLLIQFLRCDKYVSWLDRKLSHLNGLDDD